ncbi:MAG: Gfo/Idh/MocA family protein [Acidimicrobiales bacterium]
MARPQPLRLGVIGVTSRIARLALIPAITASPLTELAAVASTSQAPDLLTRRHPQGARYHDTYEGLLADPDVEAVYIPLPNSLHRIWTERAAQAGKHVLCEKPLAPTAPDARAMARACQKAGVVLMEAYMTPFHPRSQALADLVASGRLGSLTSARSAFTGILSRPDDHRWRPEMGGGALLDVGIYCLSPLLSAAGRFPRALSAAARITDAGVDSTFNGWLDFGSGLSGYFECSFEVPERQVVELVGTQATVRSERVFTPGPELGILTVTPRNGPPESIEVAGADPYRNMLEHFVDVVRHKVRPHRTPEDSIALAHLVDKLAQAARIRSGRDREGKDRSADQRASGERARGEMVDP